MPGIHDERVYWAHQLHATLLNSIGAAILQTQVCEHAVRGALPTSADELARLREMLVQLEGETRSLAAARALPGAGTLAAEVEAKVRLLRRTHPDLPVRVRLDGGDALPWRIVRGAGVVLAEALANAARHGRPSRIDVDVSVREGGLLLRVRDDGAGCDAARVDDAAAPARRCGIAIMRAQARALGGRLALSSVPGRGTQVTLYAPLSATAQR